MVAMATMIEETPAVTRRPSMVVKRVRMVADTIRAMNRMNSFHRRLSEHTGVSTSGTELTDSAGPALAIGGGVGPRGQRGSGSIFVPSGGALNLIKRRWRKASVSEGGALGPTRRLTLSRDITQDNENDRRKNRSRHVTHKKDPVGKFRLIARMAVFCARQAREHRLKDKLYDEIMPYVNEMRFHDYESKEGPPQDGGLSFDPSTYKADKQLRISEETKRVLTLPSSERTDREITYAQLALRNIHSIAEYPVRMQKKIVEVGRYEKYDAKRVVVRQGHPATAFYFILSGTVVVMVTDPETKVAKPVAYLPKGIAFGELAIIKRTTRQASIIAKETLELLSIDIEDFHRIFMAGGVKNIHDPDHYCFIRNLHFLKQWPIEKMGCEPDKCQFFFFKQGEIVVRDSRRSHWLFIVKSGSLQVLKKLKRVQAFEWKNREANPPPKVKSEREKKDEKENKEKIRRHILPELKIPLREGVESDIDSLPELPPLTHYNEEDSNRTRRLSRWTIDRAAQSSSAAAKQQQNVTTALPTLPSAAPLQNTAVRPQSWTSRSSSALTTKAVRAEGGEGAGISAGSISYGNYDSAPSTPSIKPTELASNGKKVTGRTKKVMFNIGEVKKNGWIKDLAQEEEQEEMEREMKGRKQEIRTIAQDMDAGFKQKPAELTEADLDPQFVHVQTLTKGQVFGLSELILGDQPGFCVVSNGAECIMLDKQFYRTNAPEELLRKVRNECCPYPTDGEMQEGLQASVDWEAYKNTTFMDTLTLVNQKKTLASPRKSSRTEASKSPVGTLLPPIYKKAWLSQQ